MPSELERIPSVERDFDECRSRPYMDADQEPRVAPEKRILFVGWCDDAALDG